jgi:hypothetical protein
LIGSEAIGAGGGEIFIFIYYSYDMIIDNNVTHRALLFMQGFKIRENYFLINLMQDDEVLIFIHRACGLFN